MVLLLLHWIFSKAPLPDGLYKIRIYISKCILKIQLPIHGAHQKAWYHPFGVQRNNCKMQQFVD